MKLSVIIDGLTLCGLALIGAGFYKVSPTLFVISAGATLLALAFVLARR